MSSRMATPARVATGIPVALVSLLAAFFAGAGAARAATPPATTARRPPPAAKAPAGPVEESLSERRAV
ncbi:MAG TPA: hypothetical protein VHJ20_20200, partial [Polyangia bacterium]|nr:hypothetical protein [Polyangia bacterium]